ncbi:unnamed protein product [Closterium sp. Yama58-4]|nr:unnamed protein product [Closterium sp. Yama58-4]
MGLSSLADLEVLAFNDHALGPPSLPCSPSILAYPQFLLTLNRYFLPSIPAFPHPCFPLLPCFPPPPLLPPPLLPLNPCAHLLPPTRRRVLISGGPHLPLDPHAPRLAPPRPPPTCGLLCATWRPGIGAPPAARAPGGSGAAAGRRRGGARAPGTTWGSEGRRVWRGTVVKEGRIQPGGSSRSKASAVQWVIMRLILISPASDPVPAYVSVYPSPNQVERSDVYVVRGVAPGQEKVSVQLMDADVTAAGAAAAGGAAALPSDAITLTVARTAHPSPSCTLPLACPLSLPTPPVPFCPPSAPSPVHPPLPLIMLFLSAAARPLPFITLFSPSPVSPPSQLPSPILPAVQLPSPSYAWATANASVASVHPSQGVVTALAQGATTLTATDVRVADHHQAVSIHVVTPGHVKIFLAPLAPLPGGNGGTGGEGEVCSGAGAAGGGGLPGAVACRAVAEPVASGGDTWHLVVGREYALWVQVFSHGWPSRPVLLTQADTLLLRFDHPPLWSVVGEDAAAVASLPAQAPPALEGGGGGGEERSRVVVVRGGQQGQGEVQAELRYREVQSGGKGREEKVVAVQAIRVCDPVLVHLPSPTTPASSSSPPPVDPVHVVHLPWVPQLDSAPPPLRQHLRLLASGGEQSHAL